MMLEPCGAILTHNGDSCRGDLAGIHLLNSKRGSSQINPNGREMTSRTDDDTPAWQASHVAHDLIWQSCRPGPPLVFPGEKELIRAMYDQIGKEEQVISPPYVKTTHERCGPFSLVVLSQRRGRVTTSSGPTLSETLSSKTLQVS